MNQMVDPAYYTGNYSQNVSHSLPNQQQNQQQPVQNMTGYQSSGIPRQNLQQISPILPDTQQQYPNLIMAAQDHTNIVTHTNPTHQTSHQNPTHQMSHQNPTHQTSAHHAQINPNNLGFKTQNQTVDQNPNKQTFQLH